MCIELNENLMSDRTLLFPLVTNSLIHLHESREENSTLKKYNDAKVLMLIAALPICNDAASEYINIVPIKFRLTYNCYRIFL